tara:strand:+ start:315 stop:1295 length:981 start_codon:yes stop_codon:yes gene_type:complete
MATTMNKTINMTDTFYNIDDLIEYCENTIEQNSIDKLNTIDDLIEYCENTLKQNITIEDKLKTSSNTPIFDALFRNKDIYDQIYTPLKNEYKEDLLELDEIIKNNKSLWFEHVRVWCNRFYIKLKNVEELMRTHKFCYKKNGRYNGVKFLKKDLIDLNRFVCYWNKYRQSCCYIATTYLYDYSTHDYSTFCGQAFKHGYQFRLFDDTTTFYHHGFKNASTFNGLMEYVDELNKMYYKKYPKHDDLFVNSKTITHDSDVMRFNRLLMNYDYHVGIYNEKIKKYKLFSQGDTSLDKDYLTYVKKNPKWFYGGNDYPSEYDLTIYEHWN